MDSKRSAKSYGQCRCCLENGYHRELLKEYHFNGTREIYYDIFMECFNLFLSTTANVTMLICTSCIQSLRNARNFRQMVAESEKQLVGKLEEEEMIFVNVPAGEHLLGTEVDIKMEHQVDIKVEPGEQSDFDSRENDNDYDFAEAGREEVEGEAALLARRPRGPELPTRDSLYITCPAYVKHLDYLKGKLITTKMISKLLEESDLKKKYLDSREIYVTEKLANVTNAAVLLENSNATPFRSRSRTGFPCFYCRNSFDNVTKLREHQEKVHKKSELKKVLTIYGAESLVVYADITNLKCTICDQSIPNINELKTHLNKTHAKTMYLEYADRVIPFKLSENNVFECQVCGFSFETFGSIERHMNVHYRNYICEECGTGFVTKYRLKVHVKSMHVEGNHPCELCKKSYASQQRLKNHIDSVHKMVKRFKCPKCPERFMEYFRRQKHMVTVHGLAPLRYRCNVCDKSFDRRYTLSRHMKRDHLEERDYQCEMCSYKCFTKNELRVHMIKHNGERIHTCGVCKKSYARKKTLKEHMRIHNNDRRFACSVCGQAFVQKCSLKGHIKTHHAEYGLQI